jgi:autotransporter family porin
MLMLMLMAFALLPGISGAAELSATGIDSKAARPNLIQITSPANGATVSGPVDIDVAASARAEWVNLFIDGQYYRSTPPYTWNWDTTAMTDGPHTIGAQARNANRAVASTSIRIIVNNTARFRPSVMPATPYPEPAAGSPANGYVALVWPTSGTTISGTVTVRAEISPSTAYVNLYLDSSFVASVTASAASASLDTTMSVDGSHSVVARAFDAAGNPVASDSAFVMIANGAASSTPKPAGYFSTLPPHSALPDESECASEVLDQPSAEGIPQNAQFNETTPRAAELSAFHQQPLWNVEAQVSDFARVNGNFTGSTDEIIRWASCKWGLDENAMRAEAWSETFWIQDTPADRNTNPALCQTPGWNGWDGAECWQSYGIFQSKVLDFNIWPETRDSTAFNADFRGAYMRACMNGDVLYLGSRPPNPGYPAYNAGSTDQQFWGCMGEWASGGWYDVGAIDYITSVNVAMKAAAWPN